MNSASQLYDGQLKKKLGPAWLPPKQHKHCIYVQTI